MRLLIASTYVPFSFRVERTIVAGLKEELEKKGHVVEVVLIPLCPNAQLGTQQTLAIRLLDLTEASGNPIDRLITLQTSSCALQHENKVAWIINHQRNCSEIWGTRYDQIPESEGGRRNRDWMIRSDSIYLREARKLYTNSTKTATSLELHHSLQTNSILYPPLATTDHLRQGAFGNYFVYPANQNTMDRHILLINAVANIRSEFGLVILTSPNCQSTEENLHGLVTCFGLGHKIKILEGATELEKANCIANSCGLVALDSEYDYYGYGTLEAFHSHKPVLTALDSPGNLEVVQDGMNGRVVDPNPLALAEAMEDTWGDKNKAAVLGHEGFATLGCLQINWDHVTEQLVA